MHAGVVLAGQPQVGVGGQVAEVGFLGADLVAAAVQVDAGAAEDVAVTGGEHLLQGGDDGADVAVGGAFQVVGHGLVGDVGAVDGVVQAVGEQYAVVVEAHHQAAQIFVVAVGVDHQHRFVGGGGEGERVVVGGAVAVAQAVVVVGEQGVGAAGDDDVDAFQQGGQLFLHAEGLHVGEHDDLVDALVTQLIDFRLQHVGQCLVAAAGRVDGDVAGAGDVAQRRRGGADHAQGFAAHFHGAVTGQAVGHGRQALAVAFHQAGQAGVGGEVQVGAQVGEAGAGVVALGGQDAGELGGAAVQVVVADGGALQAHGVEHGDVGAAVTGHGDAGHGVHGRVGGGEVARAGNKVVAGAEHQGVVRVFGAQGVQHRGERLHVLQRAGGAVHVREVQQLQLEAGFRRRRRCRVVVVVAAAGGKGKGRQTGGGEFSQGAGVHRPTFC